MLKTLLITTSLAAGLMMLDIAQPVLTGGIAEAAPRRAAAPRKVAAPRRAAPRRAAPHHAAHKPNFSRPKSNFHKPKAAFKFKPAPKIVHTPAPKLVKPIKVNPHVLKGTVSPNPAIKAGPHIGGLKKGPSFGKTIAHGPGGFKPGPFIKVANKSWPIHKGPHKLWWKNSWKVFVPFSAISVALIGGAYYYPDAYVSVARPYCSGVTPDGCQLNWQQVGFEGGGSEWQCVQFCPRPNQPPPPRAAALVVAPPAPAGGRCELEFFAATKFGGLNAQSEVDQPKLGEAGWKNEIASIQVKAGTWDFFTEDDFAGENMRLPPGPYPDLGPQWSKKIGSFMCVQGG
jgi:hypothetical protein